MIQRSQIEEHLEIILQDLGDADDAVSSAQSLIKEANEKISVVYASIENLLSEFVIEKETKN